MAQPVDYADASTRPGPSRWLARAAAAAILYPLALLAFVHCEWAAACVSLGHRPALFVDRQTVFGDTRGLHAAAFFAAIPVAVLSVVLNVQVVAQRRPTVTRAVARLLAVPASPAAAFALFGWDPVGAAIWCVA